MDIKKIDEYISEHELSINNIVYKTYFPKENQNDYLFLRDNRNFLWDFFNDGYKFANLKEFNSCRNPKSLWKNASCLKLAYYNDILIAASIYTDYQGGHKCVGITATTNNSYRNIGKEAIKHIIKEDISLFDNFYWTECSDAIEHLYEKHGGIKIPNDYIDFFTKGYKTLSDDGYHFTIEVEFSDNDVELVNKVIFGFNSKETFDSIMRRNDERINTFIDRINNKQVLESLQIERLPKEDYYKEIVYIFYEDRINGYQDYSQKTLNILKEAVDYLKEYTKTNKDRKYKDAFENGEELLLTATVMKLHTDINF